MKLTFRLILILLALNTLTQACIEKERRVANIVDSLTVPKDPVRIKADTTTVNTTNSNLYQIIEMDSTKSKSFFELIKAAGLDTLLQSDSIYTVLAPVDSAWYKLPGGTYQNLKQPESKATLRNVLLNHIIKNKVDPNKFVTTNKFQSMKGETLNVIVRDSLTLIEDRQGVTGVVLDTNRIAKNGRIYSIDAVLMPAN